MPRSVFDFGGTGPVLVILHATGFHGLAYAQMAEHLVPHFHCYAIDLRGSGDSTLDILPETVENGSYRGEESLYDAQNGFPTLRGYAADVVALVDYLCVKDVFLFGHSGGGLGALTACTVLGDRVRGLYMFEPPFQAPSPKPGEYLNAFKMQAPNKGLWQGAMRRTSIFASRQAALDTYKRKAFKDFDPDVLKDIVEHGFASLEGGRVQLKTQKEVEAITYNEIGNMCAQAYPEFLKVRTPMCIGCGEYGLKGAGHFAPFTHPEATAVALIKEFGQLSKL